VSARNRVFMILGLLLVGSLVWYLTTTSRSSDLQMIGTVDANEVVVSSKIPGRLQTLMVKEGDTVKAGQVIATIEAADLEAALQAAEAAAASGKWKVSGAEASVRQTQNETQSATDAAEAQLRAAQAALAQAQAQLARQKAETTRTVALAGQGIMSQQAKDDAQTSLQAAEAAANSAAGTAAAAEATLRQARAHEILTEVSQQTVNETRNAEVNARALATQARVEQSYAEIVAPADGVVNVWAARQGEVVGAGSPIVTIMDLSQTWVYAPLPETQADAVKLGDNLRVVMPSGTAVSGKVIAKMMEADFATQRDVNKRKRDIKTVQLKLLIPNPGAAFVPGMTAEVYVPLDKLVKQ
jgi:HlyD family secretion protein